MKDEQLKEPLVLRTLGYRGYLKLPRAFQERYDFNRDRLPEPVAFHRENGDEIRLCFVWSKREMDQAIALSAKDKEEREAEAARLVEERKRRREARLVAKTA